MVAVLATLAWTGVDRTMSFYDAVAHAFTTLPTGGFSTRARSIEEFGAATQWAVAFFMVVAGANFALMYRALTRRSGRALGRDEELRVYLLVLLVTAIVLFLKLVGRGIYEGEEAVRHAAFQVASIMTTTGYASADFNQWPIFAGMILVGLMFIGVRRARPRVRSRSCGCSCSPGSSAANSTRPSMPRRSSPSASTAPSSRSGRYARSPPSSSSTSPSSSSERSGSSGPRRSDRPRGPRLGRGHLGHGRHARKRRSRSRVPRADGLLRVLHASRQGGHDRAHVDGTPRARPSRRSLHPELLAGLVPLAAAIGRPASSSACRSMKAFVGAWATMVPLPRGSGLRLLLLNMA